MQQVRGVDQLTCERARIHSPSTLYFGEVEDGTFTTTLQAELDKLNRVLIPCASFFVPDGNTKVTEISIASTPVTIAADQFLTQEEVTFSDQFVIDSTTGVIQYIGESLVSIEMEGRAVVHAIDQPATAGILVEQSDGQIITYAHMHLMTVPHAALGNATMSFKFGTVVGQNHTLSIQLMTEGQPRNLLVEKMSVIVFVTSTVTV